MAVHQEAKTIEAFEKAVREHAWIGSAHPEDRRSIERHYHTRKAKLYELLGLTYVIPEEDDD